MRRRVLGSILALASACNSVFGLRETGLQDAPLGEAGGPDTTPPRPIVPPDGSMTCSGPPDFEAWTYAQRTIPFADPIGTFGVYSDDGTTHLVVTPSAGTGIWDIDLAANTATEIPGLRPPSGRSITSLSSSPDGAAIWFKVDVQTYVAYRAEGYMRRTTDLGLPDSYEVLPASPGYYDGTLRMIVRVRDASNSPQAYVELSSTDGLTWTRGAQLPFGGAGHYQANLSVDGCTLVFTRMESSIFALYRSSRASDGTFGAPVKLTNASASSTSAFNPAVTPDLGSLWFSSINPQGMFVGAP